LRSSPALDFGVNHTVYLQKGKKKLDVNAIFWENCMILKNFSLGKQPYNGPCYRRKKSPVNLSYESKTNPQKSTAASNFPLSS
jgi:hypothetical protein